MAADVLKIASRRACCARVCLRRRRVRRAGLQQEKLMLKSLCVALFSVSVAATMAQAQTSSAEPSIRDLDRLIGTWEFEDVATAAAGLDYREAGTRVCAYALDDQYVRCDSKGVIRGTERTYVFYFNYNKLERRFEMVALHGNYPRKTFYTVAVFDGGLRIELTSEKLPGDQSPNRSRATINFEAGDRAVWETRISKPGQPSNHWPVAFRDVAYRR
jgi:hypothetical protein